MATKPKKQEATLLRRFIEELYSRGVVSGEDGSQRPIFPDGVTPDRGAFIRDICISEGATRTLEIGMASGLSTLFILEALLENGAGIGAHLVIEYDRFRLKVASAKLSSITSKHFLPDHTDSRACLRTPTTSPAVVSMPDYQYNLRVCSRQVSSRKASACDTDEY